MSYRYAVKWANTSPIGDGGVSMPTLEEARSHVVVTAAGTIKTTRHYTLDQARHNLRLKFLYIRDALEHHYTYDKLRFAMFRASVGYAEPDQLFGGAHLWCWIEEIPDT